jgi:hypothetical protein
MPVGIGNRSSVSIEQRAGSAAAREFVDALVQHGLVLCNEADVVAEAFDQDLRPQDDAVALFPQLGLGGQGWQNLPPSGAFERRYF